MDDQLPPANENSEFTKILDRITDAFVALDANWHYTYVNRKAAEIFGRKPEELIGKHIWTEFPEGVGQPFYHAYYKAMDEQRHIEIQEYYPPYKRWVENRIYPSPDGLSIFFQDITGRKQSEQRLKDTEAFSENLIQTANLMVVMLDNNGCVTFLNQTAEKITGYTQEEVKGENWFEMLVPRDRYPSFWEEFNRPIAGGVPGAFENPILTRSGEERYIIWQNNEIRKGQQIVGTISYGNDITERKQAEEALRKAYDELETNVKERTKELSEANLKLQEVDRLKSEFLATMSHELRTPLNSIIGFLGITLQEISGQINEEQRKQLSMAYGSAKHLLGLISDILDLSRIESGRFELQVNTFKIGDLISEVVENLEHLAMRKGLRLSKQVSGEGLSVTTDQRRLYQILLNLAENAIKFTDRGEVAIESKIYSNRLEITVIDSGIGIKKENMDHLFEAFRQIDGGMRRRYEGTGLGLYLSRKLADLLGGSICAESKLGLGSRFKVMIPNHHGAGARDEGKDTSC